jgi:hypothetical protein
VAETKVTTPIAAGATPGTTTLTIRAQGPILPGSLSTAKSQCGKQLRLQNELGKTPWHLPSLDRLHRRQADYQDDQQAAYARP